MEQTVDRLPHGVAVWDLRLADEREVLDPLPALAGWFETGARCPARDGKAAEASGK